MMKKIKEFLFPKLRYPLVRQYDQSDCGPAVLLSILKYFGGMDSLVHVRELCNTSSEGTSLFDIIQAAGQLGLEASGAKGNYNDLMRENLPCIAHVVLENRLQHFIVIYKINETGILAGDPARGLVKINCEDFESIWKSNIVILFKRGDNIFNRQTLNGASWILAYLKTESIWIYHSVFLGLIYTGLGLMTAFFIQRLIDEFIPAANIRKILYTGGFLFFILTIKAITGYLREHFLVILNKQLSKSINADFIRHLFRLPKKFFDSRKKGDITARIHDSIKIQHSVIRISGSSIIDIMVIFGSLASVFYFSSMLGWIILICLPVYTFLLLAHTKPIRSKQQEVMKGFARVESVYIDSLNGVDDILSFKAAESFSNTNKIIFGLFQDNIANMGFIRNRLVLLSELSGALIVISVLISGALYVGNGILLLGEMMAAYSLLSYILPAINRSVDVSISLQGAYIAMRRLMELIMVEEEQDRGEEPFSMKKSLILKKIKFSWGSDKQLFNGIDLQVPRGALVSIWGPSGAGKSTLMALIQRKYKPVSGTICLDGTPVDKISLSDYRKNVAIVPQDIKIFNGTIAENILLGRPINSFDELMKMMERYGFTSFMSRFGNGIYSLIGEENRQLSGGEKQMLGLARALFTNPSILIIDEGLSALDLDIENLVFSTISAYAKEHAVLINTHNIRIIQRTDLLYVLNEGKIVQKGSPLALLRKPGHFRTVFSSNVLSFDTEDTQDNTGVKDYRPSGSRSVSIS